MGCLVWDMVVCVIGDMLVCSRGHGVGSKGQGLCSRGLNGT